MKFNDDGLSLDGHQLIDFLQEATKAILGLERLEKTSLIALPNLKVVGKYGVGLDNLDLKAMRDHGVHLGWKGGVNCRSVAEMVLGLMISMLHRCFEANRLLEAGEWVPLQGHNLTGKSVGIIGCGFVGRDLIRLLEPFNCRIFVNDIRRIEVNTRSNVSFVSKTELVGESDIVSLHTPLTEQTKGMINKRIISQMKPNAILINTARGGLVDEFSLFEALKNNKISGAVFDVFDHEPPKNEDLILLPNFFATPHIGGSTNEAIHAMGMAAINGLEENELPK